MERTNYRKRRTQSIPTDIIIEILSKLPEKYVARFSCVSKLWSSITSDPSFPRPRLLLCFQKGADLFVSSIPQHTQNSNMSYSSSLSLDHHPMMKLPGYYNRFSSKESVHGLICSHRSENPIVWNPSTRQFITLPTIPKPLGSAQKSWRTVKTRHRHRPTSDTYERYIGGVIYYLAFSCEEYDDVVMSFDVRSEKFDMIRLPSESYRMDMLITYKGRLALLGSTDYGINRRRLWILEDAQKHIWLGQDFLSPFADYDRSFKLTGLTHVGEFIYVPKKVGESFYILLCDPVRNRCRWFEFKGVADEVSARMDEDGKRKHRPYALHAFPNHIDSQLSF